MAATNLNEYYQGQGQALPSIADRTPLATQAGITGYAGTADQNNILLKFLQGGAGITNSATTPLTTSQIAPQNQLDIKSTFGTTGLDEAGASVAGANAAQKSLEATIKEMTPPQTETGKTADALTTRLNALIPQTAGQEQALADEEKKRGVETLKTQLSQLNSEIGVKSAEYDRLFTNAQGKPITMDSIIGEQRQIINAKAADISFLKAQAEGLQGNINTAMESAARAVDLKFAPILEEIKIKQAQLELIKPLLEKEEKVRAEAIEREYKEEQAKISTEIANEKDKNATLLNVMQAYPDAGITLKDTIETANEKIVLKSKIYKEKVRPLKVSTPKAPSKKSVLDDKSLDNEETVKKDLFAARGETDGYVSPQDWKAAMDDWVLNTNKSSEEFVKKFSNLVNPADPQDYKGVKVD